MSSGSSGHSVTVPEPLCSILFLIRRIVGAVGWPSTRSRQEIVIKRGRLMLSAGYLLGLQRPKTWAFEIESRASKKNQQPLNGVKSDLIESCGARCILETPRTILP